MAEMQKVKINNQSQKKSRPHHKKEESKTGKGKT
jgi:hypothetical protein